MEDKHEEKKHILDPPHSVDTNNDTKRIINETRSPYGEKNTKNTNNRKFVQSSKTIEIDIESTSVLEWIWKEQSKKSLTMNWTQNNNKPENKTTICSDLMESWVNTELYDEWEWNTSIPFDSDHCSSVERPEY